MKRTFNRLSRVGAAVGFRRSLGAALAAAALVMAALPTLAGTEATRAPPAADVGHQGHRAPVLPALARPCGHSLEAMARLTAAFNVSNRSAPPPNSPFQILYVNGQRGSTTFDVARSTTLYVPPLYNENSLPLIGNFPGNAESRREVLRCWYSQREFGVTLMQIVVDGKVVSLGAGYLSGASFAQPLADGATQYSTAAAFVAPLDRGPHSFEMRFKANGDGLREPPGRKPECRGSVAGTVDSSRRFVARCGQKASFAQGGDQAR